MRLSQLLISILLVTCSCNSQEYSITFKLDASTLESKESISLRGNIKPLSWNKDYPLSDEDNDGIYETTLSFKTSERYLRFRFTNNEQLELKGADNRIIWFKPNETLVTSHIFDEYNYYDSSDTEKLEITPEEVKEDVAILRRALNVIHPNLYKYRDSLVLESDFTALENALLENPGIANIYHEVSNLAAKIKCSHTFTNPWNQGPDVKKALFFQPDKLPLTFHRIGKRLFVDKNASENPQIKQGMEIVTIAGVSSEKLMTRLVANITSDGNNYEKRLQRLTLSGASKFELFDIFYPLEYGSKRTYTVQLTDHRSEDTLLINLPAISKTRRNNILRERYPNFENTFEDGWRFTIKDEKTAILRIDAFTIFSSDFDWKDFLNKAFKSLNVNKVENLVIDIRKNEGGDTEVAEYILERIIKKPITVDIPAQTTQYRKIPEELKPYISTWDKKPYDWGNKLEYMGNGTFEMQSMFVPRRKTYSPKKNGFQGKVFLLAGAENSSATHIMATYAKKYKLATLVGQETGGNQKGLNGGYIFFLRLPNSKVELDIPVFGINILKDTSDTYDGGIRPDIYVEKNIPDLINAVDTEMEMVLKIIKAE